MEAEVTRNVPIAAPSFPSAARRRAVALCDFGPAIGLYRHERTALLLSERTPQEELTTMSEPPDGAKDEAAECLHCEINELVQDRLQQEGADLAELAAMIIESLAELILLAPESEHSRLMADALAHFGHTFLEKSGAMEGTSRATH